MSNDQKPVRDYQAEGLRHTLPTKHEYRSARCYSNGSPLPEGWEIRPVGERGYQAFRDGYGPLYTSSSRKEVEGYTTWATTRAQVHASPRATADRAKVAAEQGNGVEFPSGDTRYSTYSSGVPLPEGWVVRYHADRREYVAYRDNRCEARGDHRAEVDRRIRSAVRTEARGDQARASAISAAAVAAAEASEAKVERLTSLMRRRERLWFAVAGVAGLLVGGIGVGLVAANQAPDAPVTPESCISAMSYAEELIEGYGDGFRGSMLSQLSARSEALNEANETVQRLTPLYQREAMKCKVQK